MPASGEKRSVAARLTAKSNSDSAAVIESVSDLFSRRVEAPTVRRILLAAIDSFAKYGFHAASTREIAKNAGLSPAAVYVHFRSKEELLFTIVSIITEWMYDRMVAANDAGGAPEELMATLVRTYVASYATMRAPMHLIQYEFSGLNPIQRKRILKRRDAMEAFFKDCLVAGCKSGVFGAANPSLTNVAIVSLCISVLNWFSPKGELNPDQLGEFYADLVLKMIAPGAVSSVPAQAR
jgi:AcrR family transcriptional regulator